MLFSMYRHWQKPTRSTPSVHNRLGVAGVVNCSCWLHKAAYSHTIIRRSLKTPLGRQWLNDSRKALFECADDSRRSLRSAACGLFPYGEGSRWVPLVPASTQVRRSLVLPSPGAAPVTTGESSQQVLNAETWALL